LNSLNDASGSPGPRKNGTRQETNPRVGFATIVAGKNERRHGSREKFELNHFMHMNIDRAVRFLFFPLCMWTVLHAQATSKTVEPLLEQHLQEGPIVTEELRQFLLQRVPPLTVPSDSQQWNKEADEIRSHALSILYHGWPRQWIDAAPNFIHEGTIDRPGYRIIKLRFEVVPGLFSTALLYEPDHLTGRAPAILDVNGHGPGGKAVEHKQKRCINQVRRGIISLSLEWFGYGELSAEGNSHQLITLLDLTGVNGLGLFYLEMRRGLDYLNADPEVDPSRIGMTGLSGGGWQTILLSALDKRVGPAVPVAGFSSLTTAIEHPEYSGDAEQNASDFRLAADYSWLAAIRAPRPTLLIYNDMDDCCFRAGVVKQGVFSDVKPFFDLTGGAGDLLWYGNQDPGTHNYQIQSREKSYQFFDRVFHINTSEREDADTDAEVLSYADLIVGLPEKNLTILGLAQSFATSIHHEIPAQPDAEWMRSHRLLLRQDVHYTPVDVSHAWVINSTHERGLETHSFRFQFSNGLSAVGVLFQSSDTEHYSGTTILLTDRERSTTIDDVANYVDRGQRVLILEPLFFGEDIPDVSAAQFAALLNTMGERPLGLEAAQLTAIVRWLGKNLTEGSPSSGSAALSATSSATAVNVVTSGPRSETVAMVASALEPELFSALKLRESIRSLIDVFNHPSNYQNAPEITCLDLFRDFDFNLFEVMASGVKENFPATASERIFWD